jgi:hypothetical protein
MAWRCRLFIHANGAGKWGSDTGYGSNDEQRARSVMARSPTNLRPVRSPNRKRGCLYIYAGLNAFRAAISMALTLKARAKTPSRRGCMRLRLGPEARMLVERH